MERLLAVKLRIILAIAGVITAGCKQEKLNGLGPTSIVRSAQFDYGVVRKPPPTGRRVPSGTIEDPFIGEGVVVELSLDLPKPRVIIKHRPIPDFMYPMVMFAPLTTREVAANIEEGDFVKVFFDLTKENTFEIFRMERLPDAATFSHQN